MINVLARATQHPLDAKSLPETLAHSQGAVLKDTASHMGIKVRLPFISSVPFKKRSHWVHPNEVQARRAITPKTETNTI